MPLRPALTTAALVLLGSLATAPASADPVTDAAFQAQALASAPQGLWGEWHSNGNIVLEWYASPTMGTMTLLDYKVYRFDVTDPLSTGVTVASDGTDTSFLDVSGVPGHLYLYTVTAVYSDGVLTQESTLSLPTYVGDDIYPRCSLARAWVPPPQPGYAVYPECLL